MARALKRREGKKSARYLVGAEAEQFIKRVNEMARFLEMEKGMKEREYLTRAEVAALLEVSPSSISRWARQGRLPSVRTIGGRRRYPKESICFLIQSLSRQLNASVAPDAAAARPDGSDRKKQ